jgi:hypothetical protein
MIQDRSNTKLKVVVAKENYSLKVKVTPLQFSKSDQNFISSIAEIFRTTLMAQSTQNSRGTRFI